MVIVSHTIQTLHLENSCISYQDYIYDINYASTNIQNILLVFLQHLGHWGNSMFFVCSAWFLLNDNSFSKKKCFSMISEVWVVSVIIAISSYFILDGNICFTHMFKSFFPITFLNNWYITCYLLFYAVHPFLNKIIDGMSKITLFRCTALMSFLYIGINVLYGGLFFSTRLVVWITIYFIMAYIKKYGMHLLDNFKVSLTIFVFGLAGHTVSIVLTNFLGLHISYFSNKMFFWFTDCNPFLIAMAIGLFFIAKNIYFQNRIVNYISGFTMFFYIIHENPILRTYFRTAMWEYVYHTYGYSNIVVWALILSLIIFLFCFIMAILYKVLFKGIVQRVSNCIYAVLRKKYLSFETKYISRNIPIK